MPDGLKLVIGADVKQAEQALKTFTEDLSKTGAATDKFGAHLSVLERQVNAFGGGVKKFSASFSTSFNVLPPSIKKVETALTKLPRSSNAATQSLINLGRVAQDAPFGIIGIANNINPLLESFQRLKAESGSTGVAIKSLVGSLIGGGGLGLAVSVATGLMSFFALRSRGAKDEVTEASKAVDVAGEKQKHFSQAIDQAASSIIAQAATLKDLRAILITTTGTTQELTDATIKQGLARFIFDEKNVELQKIIGAQIQKQIVLRKRLVGVAGLPEFKADAQAQGLKTFQQSLERLGEGNFGGILKDIKTVDQLNKTISEAGGEINLLNALGPDLNNFFKGFLDKPKKDADDFIERAKKLASELEKIGFIQPEFSFFDSLETQMQKAKKVFADFNSRNLKINPQFFKVEPTISEPRPEQVQAALNSVEEGIRSGIIVAPKIPLEIEPSFSTNALSNFSLLADKELANAFRVVKIPMSNLIDFEKPAGFNLNVLTDTLRKALGAGKDATREELIAIAIELQKGVDNINGIIKNIAVEGIANFAQSFGAVFAGGDLKNIFSGFVNVLADGLSAIGKQMIALSPVIASLKAALKTLNPAILLPAGVALVAIGSALRSTVGKGITGFAQGGLVFGPTMGLVGEGIGTSRSNPEVIAPLDQLKGMLSEMGGGVQHVIVSGRLRGRDMALQNARTSRSQRRLGVR